MNWLPTGIPFPFFHGKTLFACSHAMPQTLCAGNASFHPRLPSSTPNTGVGGLTSAFEKCFPPLPLCGETTSAEWLNGCCFFHYSASWIMGCKAPWLGIIMGWGRGVRKMGNKKRLESFRGLWGFFRRRSGCSRIYLLFYFCSLFLKPPNFSITPGDKQKWKPKKQKNSRQQRRKMVNPVEQASVLIKRAHNPLCPKAWRVSSSRVKSRIQAGQISRENHSRQCHLMGLLPEVGSWRSSYPIPMAGDLYHSEQSPVLENHQWWSIHNFPKATCSSG